MRRGAVERAVRNACDSIRKTVLARVAFGSTALLRRRQPKPRYGTRQLDEARDDGLRRLGGVPITQEGPGPPTDPHSSAALAVATSRTGSSPT